MKNKNNDNFKAVNSRLLITITLVLVVLMVLTPAVCYASEPGLSLIAWVTIFPGQYIIIVIYTYLIKIGRRRKRLLIDWFILGHVLFPFLVVLLIPGRHIPEFVAMILPFCYWLILFLCMIYFRRHHRFDDPQIAK